jgi:hypothetical protein
MVMKQASETLWSTLEFDNFKLQIEELLPDKIFSRKGLTRDLKASKPIHQKDLMNLINHLHFKGDYILVRFRHPYYKNGLLAKAYPEPCLNNTLICRWSNKTASYLESGKYRFLDFIMDDGKSVILVPALFHKGNHEHLIVQLPEKSYVLGVRGARRHPCGDVTAELHQNGFEAKGELVDFSSAAFRIRALRSGPGSFDWFNFEIPVNVYLRRGPQIIFSGSCLFVRQADGHGEGEVVLAPAYEEVRRFKKRAYRNPRLQLVPRPYIVFDHPIYRKRVQLEVRDICSSGFSVYEEAGEGCLMQGMVIPSLTINLGGAAGIECVAQVIYSLKEDTKKVRLGLSILDLDINAYSRLAHVITRSMDPNAFGSGDVDLDALWEFFFGSGFIYPKKYSLAYSHREDFKETYNRLYGEESDIAKHFTYQRNGRIYGHVSVVRAYEKTWLIHHHAARSMDNKRAGFLVLKQAMHYLNDFHRLPSSGMRYVMSYFRPENRFPDRVFGEFSRTLGNPKACSMDLFSYLLYTRLSLGGGLPDGWVLGRSSALHMSELHSFYNHVSGGVLLDALGIGAKRDCRESLEERYARQGFFRKIDIYSLTHREELKAVLIVNQSDPGLNLSELLNCIKVLVTKPEELSWKVLSTAIALLTRRYKMEKIPILFYPFDYVKANAVPYEKLYQIWAFDVKYGDNYMEFMHKRFKIEYKSTTIP